MLSNFNFGIGEQYQCTPSMDFSCTCSGTTSSGFDFKSYDANFPTDYYTGSYTFLFGITDYKIYHILPGSDNELTAVAAGIDFFATTTTGTEYDVKPSIPEILDYSYHAPNINDIALIGF